MSSSEPSWVSIHAHDDCSELYLEDERYNIVAKGIGELYQQVQPGIYKIRQRIGDQEHAELIYVPPDESVRRDLDGLAFNSPIPSVGAAVSVDSRRLLFNLDVTSLEQRRQSALCILIWDPQWKLSTHLLTQPSVLEAESLKLQIESLDGRFVQPLEKIAQFNRYQGRVYVHIDLTPGPYVLTQKMDDGALRRIMLPIHERWSLHLFMTTPAAGENAGGLDLNRAAVLYSSYGSFNPTDPAVALLEVARKALARGRAQIAPAIVDSILNAKWTSPILGLMGAHLLLNMRDPDTERARRIIDRTAELLGQNFADIIALRLRLNTLDPSQPLPDAPLTHPPLLAASWQPLLAFNEARDRGEIEHFFWSPFMVESSATWFVWKELPEAPSELALDSRYGTRMRAITAGQRALTKLPDLVRTLLEHDKLQYWLQDLKNDERANNYFSKELTPFDRDLLVTVSSAQASLIPGIIEADTAVNAITRGLRVPSSVARDSALKLSDALAHWVTASSPDYRYPR